VVTGLPPGVNGLYHPTVHVFQINGTPTQAGTFNYTVTTTGTCVQATATGTITVNPDATITLTSEPGTTNQSVCINNPITNIAYAIGGGGTGAGITGLPPGIAGVYNAGVFTISGTPTGAGTFNYTVTTTGMCSGASASGTITVNPDATITLTSEPWTTNQTVCINDPIEYINYFIEGGWTDIEVTGLPAGVTGSYIPTAHIFRIGGIPTMASTFNYTVTATGTCAQAIATGAITVNPDATIALTSPPGSNIQKVCINTYITNITYSIGGGGTGAHLVNLPFSGNYNAGVFTISGCLPYRGFFLYNVWPDGPCENPYTREWGIIEVVDDLPTIDLTSPPGSNDQSLCINTPITNITYFIGGGGTGATVTGLPTGVTGVYNAGVFTISGMPNEQGTFNYTITVTSLCPAVTTTGSIKIYPTVSGPKSVCAYTTGNGFTFTTEAGMSNYMWTISGGIIINGGTSTDNYADVQWNNPGICPGVGLVSVNYTNVYGCNVANPTNYIVTINPPAYPTISGIDPTECAAQGTDVFTQHGMSNYIWTCSAGITISGYGTSTDNRAHIIIDSAGAQSVSVNYTDTMGCHASIPTTCTINVVPRPVSSITGPSVICGIPNVGNIYSTQPGMAEYDWYLSPYGSGSFITSGFGTNAISVTWNNVGYNAVVLNVTSEFGCPQISNTVYPVSVSAALPPGAAGLISGPTAVLQGQTGVVYSTPTIQGATGYTWELPFGAVITAGETTNTITVSFGPDAVSGIITVAGTDGVCSGPVSPGLNITVIPGNTTLTGDVTNTACYNAVQTITVAGGSNTFTVMNGGSATMIAGHNIFYEPLTKVHPGGYMHGYISNTFCGGNIYAPMVAEKAGQAEQRKGIDPLIIKKESLFEVYPNPTTGSYTLELASEPGEMPVKVKCYNLVGSLIMEENIYSGITHELSLAGQMPGIYLVRVIRDGDTRVRKLIKQ
jgi:hypothetical protein